MIKKRITVIIVIAFMAISCSRAVRVKPIDKAELKKFGVSEIAGVYRKQSIPAHPLDLYEVISRVLKYNTHRIKYDIDIKKELASLSSRTRKILPVLEAKSSYSYRDKVYASKQLNLTDDTPITGSGDTYSSERKSTQDTLAISWNLLTLWDGYLAAKIQGDNILYAREQRRKAIFDYIISIFEKYWIVSYGQRHEKRAHKILKDISKALANLKSPEFYNNHPEESLKRQKNLLEQRKRVNEYLREINEQKLALAFLMGLPPGTYLRLKEHRELLPVFNLPAQEADMLMWVNSPSIRVAAYKERISVKQSKAEFVKLFPALKLDFNFNKTSDKLRVYNSWRQGSADIFWNILNLTNIRPERRRHKFTRESARTERILDGITSFATSRLNQLLYLNALEKYADSVQLHQVEKLFNKISTDKFSSKVSSTSFMELVESRVDELYTGMERARSYAQIIKYSLLRANSVSSETLNMDFDKMNLKQINRYVYAMLAGMPIAWLQQPGAEKKINNDSGGNLLKQNLARILRLWQREKKSGVAEPGRNFMPLKPPGVVLSMRR